MHWTGPDHPVAGEDPVCSEAGIGGIPGNVGDGRVEGAGGVELAAHDHDFIRFEPQRLQPFRLNFRQKLPNVSARSNPAQREMGGEGS